tara:strand:+ start:285 stop:758 length:474 start_codon:yes stop_codon:yes gene_type:complete
MENYTSQREGSAKLEIFPFSKTHFIFEDGMTSYEFSDKEGVKYAAFATNDETFIGKESNKLAPVEKTAIALPETLLLKYVGKYELGPGAVMEISAVANQIFAQLTGQPQFEIFAEKEDSFFLKVVEAKIVFNNDQNGNVIGLTLLQNGREIPAKKIE